MISYRAKDLKYFVIRCILGASSISRPSTRPPPPFLIGQSAPRPRRLTATGEEAGHDQGALPEGQRREAGSWSEGPDPRFPAQVLRQSDGAGEMGRRPRRAARVRPTCAHRRDGRLRETGRPALGHAYDHARDRGEAGVEEEPLFADTFVDSRDHHEHCQGPLTTTDD